MPTLESVKQFRQEMFDSSMALIDKKGADYNREQQLSGDTLFNLKVCEILGIVPTAERGILVRLSDKLMRLISLMQPGVEAAVKDESVRDTVRDIHNYVDYALQLWEERRKPTVLELPQPEAICPGRPERVYRDNGGLLRNKIGETLHTCGKAQSMCDEKGDYVGFVPQNKMGLPEHVCGLSGYNPMKDPPCPACVSRGGTR